MKADNMIATVRIVMIVRSGERGTFRKHELAETHPTSRRKEVNDRRTARSRPKALPEARHARDANPKHSRNLTRCAASNPPAARRRRRVLHSKNLATDAQSMGDGELENLWKQSARYVTTTSVGPGYTAG